VRTDAGARRTLDANYVALHVQHAYALTAHTIQGGAVQWAGVVGRPEDFTRNWSYTALSRARDTTELFLIDAPTERELDRTEIAAGQAAELGDERTPVERLAAAMRQRDDEELALDRVERAGARAPVDREPADVGLAVATDISHRSIDDLRAELAQLRGQMAHYPDHVADQLHAARSARAEAQRVAEQARGRIAELDHPARRLSRLQPVDRQALAVEGERLELAERHAAAAAERERKLALDAPDRATCETDVRLLGERAAELDAELSVRRSDHVRAALQRPSSYLVTALGPPPNQPRALRTWQQAAQRVETYRFDHAITAPRDALGPEPTASAQRTSWRRAQHELQRVQHDLGQRMNRGLGREL
jgi:hypothetical protein